MGKDYVMYDRKKKKYYARVPYYDEGVRKYKYKIADDRSDAKRRAVELFIELEEKGVVAFARSCKSFSDLCDYYKPKYLIAAEYIDGHKVTGLRSYKDAQNKLEFLRRHFGSRRLKEITYGDLLAFRTLRFRTPIIVKAKTRAGAPTKRPRSAAAVHLELSLLRHMLNVAEREGFIRRNPFKAGEPLIRKSIETKRNRVLFRAEELLMLAACVGWCEKLRALLICALDTGMRMNEIYNLAWSGVDLRKRKIKAVSYKGKVRLERDVPISSRLALELSALPKGAPDKLLFGDRDSYRRAFAHVKKVAGVEDFRFHDCRHTCGTRLAEGGMQATEIARILGHTNLQTVYRYINITETTVDRAAEILDKWQAAGSAISSAVN